MKSAQPLRWGWILLGFAAACRPEPEPFPSPFVPPSEDASGEDSDPRAEGDAGESSGGSTDPGSEEPDSGSGSGEETGGASSGDDGVAGEPACGDQPGPRLLRRLTRLEYEASVRAALGLDPSVWPGPAVPPDPAAGSGFTNQEDLLVVTPSYGRALQTDAEILADLVVEPEILERVAPCPVAGADCVDAFLYTVGRRLYRRSLATEEIARYRDLWDRVVAEGGTWDAWVWWATRTLLQSPNFLYRSELGEAAGDVFALTSHEIATALAFTFTGGPPSDALLDRADADAVRTPQEIEEALALLVESSDRIRPELQRFHRQWLGLTGFLNLEKDPTLFPTYGANIRDAMERELEAFLDDVVFVREGGVDLLLTHGETHVDAELATYYGYASEASGPTAKPPGHGVGLLALGAVLSTHATFRATSPTQRGKMIRAKLLCTEPPPPPPDIGELEPAEGFATTRERYEEHTVNPACRSCHALMDPLGFALEHFDAAGKYRPTENGHPIDARGDLAGLGPSIAFDGAESMAQALVLSGAVHGCLIEQLGAFGFGLARDEVECLVDPGLDPDEGILAAYLRLASARHFRERR